MIKIVFLAVLTLGLANCVTTRGGLKEQEEKAKLEAGLQTLRVGKADLETQISELRENSRALNGQFEVISNDLQLLKSAQEEKEKVSLEEQKSISEKIDAILLSFDDLDKKVTQTSTDILGIKEQMNDFNAISKNLEERLTKLEKKKSESAKVKKPSPKKTVGPYTRAEKLFGEKKWKEAIKGYQEYRRRWPKGKQYTRATFRMGVSFKNLKLNKEAKAFFQEVVARSPKSSYAKEATTLLKKL